jgi:hypothetical protein
LGLWQVRNYLVRFAAHRHACANEAAGSGETYPNPRSEKVAANAYKNEPLRDILSLSDWWLQGTKSQPADHPATPVTVQFQGQQGQGKAVGFSGRRLCI